jgi:lysophospholipase L1-like esterase
VRKLFPLSLAVAAALACMTLTAAAASPQATPAKKCKHQKKKHPKKKKAKKCKKKHSPVSPPAPQPVANEYISLGDSLAAGLGASNSANGYVSLLYTHYQSTLGVTSILRLGQLGATTSSLIGFQLGSAVNEINGPSDTRVVTIDIGGSDLLAGCGFGSNLCAENFKLDFERTLLSLQGALDGDPGDEPLIAMAYYNPDSGGGADEAGYDTKLLGTSKLLDCSDLGDEVGLNDAIAKIASLDEALLANPYPAFKAPGAGQNFMSGDHIHANDAGHRAMADAFIAAGAPCP